MRVVTNHLLYQYPTVADLPAGDGNGMTYARFRTLTSLFSDQPTYTPDEVIERHAIIRFARRDIPIRTLWYVLYGTRHSSDDRVVPRP